MNDLRLESAEVGEVIGEGADGAVRGGSGGAALVMGVGTLSTGARSESSSSDSEPWLSDRKGAGGGGGLAASC